MKKYVYLLSALLLFAGTGAALAQKKNQKDPSRGPVLTLDAGTVPSAVSARFAALHPDAGKVSWIRDHRYNYEATFSSGGHDVLVMIDEFGNMLQTETVLSMTDLPKNISPQIATGYADYETGRIVRLESGAEVTYNVVVRNAAREARELVFDLNGNFVREMQETRR